MKSRTLSLNEKINKLSQKKLFTIWCVYHIAVLFLFLLSLIIFHGKIGIDSDLFNLVPKSISMASVKKADEKMMSVTSQNVFVLVANEDFSEAKRLAESVYGELKDSNNFDSISLYNDVSAMSEITDFLYEYRSYLIDEKTADKILASDEGAMDFAMEALSKAYGGFTMLPLDSIDSDPFLLTEYHLQNYLGAVQNAGTAMSVKDGVLSSHGGLTYGGFITGNDMKQHYMNDCFSALKEYAEQNGIKEIIYKHIPQIYQKQYAEEDLYSLFYNVY